MAHYQSGKSIITAACYKNGNNDESDNNKDKICSLLKR